jgi:hypothetical protein
MPLTRLKNEYLEQDGVHFLMEDEIGSTVACRVSHEALRDHADRVHFSGTDSAVFEAYREQSKTRRVRPSTLKDHSMIMAGYLSPLKRSHG